MLAPAALWAAGLVAAASPPDTGSTADAREAGGRAELSVLIARHGTMTRVRLDGGRLVARDAGGAVLASRGLAESDRARLLAAARAVQGDNAPQWSCPADETFVSVTIDGRTASSAVCPDKNGWRAHPDLWRALVALVRLLLGVGT